MTNAFLKTCSDLLESTRDAVEVAALCEQIERTSPVAADLQRALVTDH